MARKSINTIKGYFETGDVPTQSQFSDLIDSTYNSTSGIETLSTGFTNLSVISLSSNEIYIEGTNGPSQDITLTTPTGTATFTIKSGIITNITTT